MTKEGEVANELNQAEPLAEAQSEGLGQSSESQPQTSPDNCCVVGDGISKVAVRQEGVFEIHAYGATVTDARRVACLLHCHSRCLTRVCASTDMRDGTYVVEWKPSVSGSYQIAVSLFGNSLPGSPYGLEVDAPFPYAPNCEARGDALSSATARVSHWFEMRFRDRLGNVAKAVDLDVFVQPGQAPGAQEDMDPPATTGSPSGVREFPTDEQQAALQPAAPRAPAPAPASR